MWDTLEECTAWTIDQFFTRKQTFFRPNSTFPPSPPHSMLFVRKACRRVVQHYIGGGGGGGGKGKRANIAGIREKGTVSHTFWPGLYIHYSAWIKMFWEDFQF